MLPHAPYGEWKDPGFLSFLSLLVLLLLLLLGFELVASLLLITELFLMPSLFPSLADGTDFYNIPVL